jgi:hypothetical protein
MVFAPIGRTYRCPPWMKNAHFEAQPRTNVLATKNTHFDFLLQQISNVNIDAQKETGLLREALWDAVTSIWKWVKKARRALPPNDEKWRRASAMLAARVSEMRVRHAVS